MGKSAEILVENPAWDDVPYFKANALVTGGPDCPDNVPIQALLNRTAYLNNRISGLGSGDELKTPPQFDKSKKAATTEFVQRALGNLAGTTYITGDSTIGYDLAGQMLECVGTAAAAWTFPEAKDKACLTYLVWNNSSAVLTLRARAFYGPSASTADVSQVVVQPGLSVSLISDGSNWIAVNGAAPTAPQFDKSGRLATTEFVQRAIGSFQSGFEVTTSIKLVAADVGRWVNLAGTVPFTVTLPTLDSVPDGATFLFHNDAAGVAHTLIPAGSDRFAAAGLAYSTLTVGHGEFVIVTKAATVWRTAGSAVLKNEAQFGSSLTGNGWQRLPSGLIIQWGSVTRTGVTNAPVLNGSINYSMAFPNAVLSLVAASRDTANTEVYGNAGTTPVVVNVSSGTNAGFIYNLRAPATTMSSEKCFYWIAIGY